MAGGGALTSTFPFMKRWSLRTLPVLTQVSCTLQPPAARLLSSPRGRHANPLCSFCHKLAPIEAGKVAPRCSPGWWAWPPRETGTHPAFLPSEKWAGLLHCSRGGQPPSGIWEPEEEKGLSSAALLLPHLHHAPPRAHTALVPRTSHPARW